MTDAVPNATAADGVPTIDAREFRRTLSNFCTGVTVIAAMGPDEEPAGFACQSFSALSLEPPLVLFCPTKTSRTWPSIQAAGNFCVNVLAHDQQDVSKVFGASGPHKFSQVVWTPSPTGSPIIDNVLTWIDCAVDRVVDGGDHWIVIGRVLTLGAQRDARPLLFYRGHYSQTERVEPTPGVLDNLFTWTQDDWF